MTFLKKAQTYSFYIKIVLINITILICIDLLSRLLLPPVSINLNSGWGAGGKYSSNYRNYFNSRFDKKYNQTIFTIDDSEDLLWTRSNRDKVEDGKIKVLFVGDSFTEGQGVKRKDTYSKKIEQLSSRVATYNRGRGGADIKEIYDIFHENIDEINPKIVVYGYVLNDPVVGHSGLTNIPTGSNNVFKWDFINDRTSVFNADRSKLLATLCSYSNILSYIVHQYERWSVTQYTINHYNEINSMKYNQKGMSETIELIMKMKSESEKKGAKFIVAIFPLFYNTQSNYPFISAHESLNREFAKHSIKTIDLLGSYKGIKDSLLWVHPTDQHPNDYAHEIAAKKILGEINLVLSE